MGSAERTGSRASFNSFLVCILLILSSRSAHLCSCGELNPFDPCNPWFNQKRKSPRFTKRKKFSSSGGTRCPLTRRWLSEGGSTHCQTPHRAWLQHLRNRYRTNVIK